MNKSNSFKVGNIVVLRKLPDWQLSGLSVEDGEKFAGFIGKRTKITEIDRYGYIWIGFGETKYDPQDGYACYEGDSFCVTTDCLSAVGVREKRKNIIKRKNRTRRASRAAKNHKRKKH